MEAETEAQKNEDTFLDLHGWLVSDEAGLQQPETLQ